MKMPQPLFEFASESKKLSVLEGEVINTPLADLNPYELLKSACVDADQKALICGIIPFDPQQPSHLIKAQNFSWKSTRNVKEQRQTENAPRIATPSIEEKVNNQHRRTCYQESVALALKEIGQAKYQKIVLARSHEFTIATAKEPVTHFDNRLFSALLQRNPSADIFTVRTSETETWTGASPEIVSDVRQNMFKTRPLAGSLNQAVQPDAQKAQSLLLNSTKDLREHAFVVNHIKAKIEKLPGAVVHVPPQPSMTSTDTMWHLGTTISAVLPREINALDIARAIHPTPAVCGVPTPETLQRIKELEQEPRSFYSGLVGWMDAQGNGRWSLVLRCTRRREDKLTVFAGAGIVKGSVPSSELAETEAKMQTIIKVLSPEETTNLSSAQI